MESKTDRNLPVQEGLRILAKLIARRILKDLQKTNANPPNKSTTENTTKAEA